MNNKSGFTLIELIVVIAILGVLALILVPNFMGYLDDAKETTSKSNATNAYKIASATAAKGAATTAGSFPIADIQKAVDADYAGAVIECDNADACTKVISVTLKTSGVISKATNGGAVVVEASAPAAK